MRVVSKGFSRKGIVLVKRHTKEFVPAGDIARIKGKYCFAFDVHLYQCFIRQIVEAPFNEISEA